MRLLRELVKDINLFLQRQDMSQQKLADRCNISTNAIRDLQKGVFFPSWGTYGVLRTRVPSALDRANRELGDRIVALQQRIDEERKRRGQ